MKKPFHLILIFAGALFALSPLAARPASAEILFAGGEDSDFTRVGNCSVNMLSSYYNVNFARSSLLLQNPASTNPPFHYFLSPSFSSAASDVWVHAVFSINSSSTGNNYQALALLSPGDGVARIVVTGTGSNGQLKIRKGDAAGTFTDLATATSTFAPNVLMTLDLHINYAVGGSVTLYFNGVQVANYTGDVTTDGTVSLDKLRLSSPSSSTYNNYWSEIIVSTTDTRMMRLVTLAASADGTTTNWDNGGVTNVNETTLNDTTVNSSGTAGQLQLYTVGNLPSGSSVSVIDVWQNIRAQVDTTGPQHIRGALRTGGANYYSSNLSPPQNSWGTVSAHWATNPATGVAWTSSEVDALEIGFDSQN
jgi:hypothetical protein